MPAVQITSAPYMREEMEVSMGGAGERTANSIDRCNRRCYPSDRILDGNWQGSCVHVGKGRHFERRDVLGDKIRVLAGPQLILSLGLYMLFLFSMSVCAAKKKSPIEIPEGSAGIVAYGSLISLPSMEQTLGHKYRGPIHQIHLTGYEREWICVRPFNDPRRIDAFFSRGHERVPIAGTAELNIYPKKKGRVNAILYLISNADVTGLDKREWGYRRVDVTGKIEEFEFRGGKVYVYEGVPGRAEGSSSEKGTYILIKEFADLVTGACDAIGKDFRDEFDKSTRPCAYQVVSYQEIVWEKAE
jgi:hypothetical protein